MCLAVLVTIFAVFVSGNKRVFSLFASPTVIPTSTPDYSINNQIIIKEVRDYFSTLVIPADQVDYGAFPGMKEMRGARDLEVYPYIGIHDVQVIDYSSNGSEARVICLITLKILQEYTATSLLDYNFSFLVGPAPHNTGDLITNEMHFLFRRYESGWRLESLYR